MPCRIIYDDCTPTRERRPTRKADIEDDIHVVDTETDVEIYELLLDLLGYDEVDLDIDPALTTKEKITEMLDYFNDPGDGNPNIIYLKVDGKVEQPCWYDCCSGLDLDTCTEQDVIDACKKQFADELLSLYPDEISDFMDGVCEDAGKELGVELYHEDVLNGEITDVILVKVKDTNEVKAEFKITELLMNNKKELVKKIINTKTESLKEALELNKGHYDLLPGFVCELLDEIIEKYGEEPWFEKFWEEYREHVIVTDMRRMKMPGFFLKKYLENNPKEIDTTKTVTEEKEEVEEFKILYHAEGLDHGWFKEEFPTLRLEDSDKWYLKWVVGPKADIERFAEAINDDLTYVYPIGVPMYDEIKKEKGWKEAAEWLSQQQEDYPDIADDILTFENIIPYKTNTNEGFFDEEPEEVIHIYTFKSPCVITYSDGDYTLDYDKYGYAKDVQDMIEDDRVDLAEYLPDASWAKSIKSITLEIIDDKGTIALLSRVECDAELDEDEIEMVKDYLTGQFSDGYGEGFEQREIDSFIPDDDYSYDEDEDDYGEKDPIYVYCSLWWWGNKYAGRPWSIELISSEIE